MRYVTRPDGYTVSPHGEVFNPKGDKLNSWLSNGYPQVKIRGVKHYVHRLVAEAFIPNPENKQTVNHKDGIKTHSFVENLEWATYSENTIHAYKTKLMSSGSGHGRAKLTDEDVLAIRAAHADYVHGWTTEMARKYNVSDVTISKIVRGISYRDAGKCNELSSI